MHNQGARSRLRLWQLPLRYYGAHETARISRSLPRWLGKNDSLKFHIGEQQFITEFLREIYTCLDNNSARTAFLTIRALLEHIIIDLIGDHGGLSKNIKQLKLKGHVTERDGTALEAIIEMGSASMHRGHKPNVEDLHTSLDIIENLIELVYLSESRGKKLEGKTPKRGQKKMTAPADPKPMGNLYRYFTAEAALHTIENRNLRTYSL